MDTRQQICEAAMRIAVRDGLLAITIDRVAQETGLSKGGVTHHFRSKPELLLAVVKHFGEFLERQLTTLVAEDTRPEFRWIRAMLEITYPAARSPGTCSPAARPPAEEPGTRPAEPLSATDPALGAEGANRMMMSILAASLHDRQLLEPIREIGQRMQRRLLDDNHGEVDQLLYWLVLDGLFVWELAGLIVPGEPLHERIVARLRDMAAQSRSWSVSAAPSASLMSDAVPAGELSSAEGLAPPLGKPAGEKRSRRTRTRGAS